MDSPTFVSRVFASLVDLVLVGVAVVFVYLLMNPFSPSPWLLAGVLSGVFLVCRVAVCLLGDPRGRGTPGRYWCNLVLHDVSGDDVGALVALFRRLLADVLVAGLAAVGLWGSSVRFGVAVSAFTRFEWMVAAVIAVDLGFILLLAVRVYLGQWCWPHDAVAGTEVDGERRGEVPVFMASPSRVPTDAPEDVPVFDAKARAAWRRWAGSVAGTCGPCGVIYLPLEPFKDIKEVS